LQKVYLGEQNGDLPRTIGKDRVGVIGEFRSLVSRTIRQKSDKTRAFYASCLQPDAFNLLLPTLQRSELISRHITNRTHVEDILMKRNFNSVRNRARSGFVVALLFAHLSGPAFAHHGYSAYDMTQVHSAKATITSFEMANPHSSITCDVKNPQGEVEHWVIETGAPMRGMRAGGFTPDTLKPGDAVTIYYYAAKNGSHVGAFVKVELPDGRVLPQKNPGSDAP
jgi:hypothetical protein